ncbi:N-acetylmuramoyl-L-alanine amidase family protein, partial [Peptoniphilaceae bacterium SGI.097]
MDIYRSRQARLVILFLFIMFLFLPIHTVHAAEGETTSDAITVTAEERQRIQSAGWYRSAESGRIFYITSELRTLTGLHEINGSLYLFNENGELYNINQWIHTEGKEFFVSPTGALYRNRFISFGESAYYYLGDDGSVQKGIIYVNGIGYYMDPSTGIMHKTNCWLKTGGERYFISPT